MLFEDVRVERGAEVRTAVLDERCESSAGTRWSVRAPSGRVARDEDVVLAGLGCEIGRGAHVDAGARLEPGTTDR